jgi:hypothetical protein
MKIKPKPKPVVALGYVEQKDLPKLLASAKQNHLDRDARLVVGNYGISKTYSDEIHALRGATYAPMFTITDGLYDARPGLTRGEKKIEGKGRFAAQGGKLPTWQQLLASRSSPSKTIATGVELGRRMRDQIRAATRGGTKIEAWQLDEILAEAQSGTPRQAATIRQFEQGVLLGLYGGRPELGDKPMQGITYLAHTALGLADARGRDASTFWRTLDRTSFRIAGEEYPDFTGSAAAAARSQSWGQRTLHAMGGARARIAAKYIPCLTPGYRLVPGLGGNTSGKSHASVDRWRDGYVQARRHEGVSGFAEFNFRFGNSDPQVIDATLKAIDRGIKGKK